MVNETTKNLRPYPMETLTRIRNDLITAQKKVFDFGTGDPKIPLWPALNEKLCASVPKISQYPTARGSKELIAAQKDYLRRRFGIQPSPDIEHASTRGSKEAVFHVALSIIDRDSPKRMILYPDPGYPVYHSSTLFAGGIPYPIALKPERQFLMEPWTLPAEVQNQARAIWVNYPHNPTGATATVAYWQQMIAWCHAHDVLLLSDDCYVDIYDPEWDEPAQLAQRPICPLMLSTDRVVCFFTLSKRSGMTGYRSGFMAGDARFMTPHLEARANMGVGSPTFIEAASVLAWGDDAHVATRRKIFAERIAAAAPTLMRLGLLDTAPTTTFYLWCRIPQSYGDDDVRFCLELAKLGVITSPSQWLSHGMRGWFRLALVPEADDTQEALNILERFVKQA